MEELEEEIERLKVRIEQLQHNPDSIIKDKINKLENTKEKLSEHESNHEGNISMIEHHRQMLSESKYNPDDYIYNKIAELKYRKTQAEKCLEDR